MALFPYLQTAPGLGLIWCAPTPLKQRPAASPAESTAVRRARALWASHADRGGDDFLGDAPPWREATLLAEPAPHGAAAESSGPGGAAAVAGHLVDRVERLRQARGDLLLRVERDWSGEPAEGRPGAGPAWADRLARSAPLVAHGLIHHPNQLTPWVAEEISRLAEAGLPVSCEIWLSRGFNDDPGLLREFLPALAEHGVRPYYLVHGEWLPPVGRIPSEDLERLGRGLRGWISGLAVPQIVLEERNGSRRPVVPDYLLKQDESGVEVKNFRGRRYRYANPGASAEGSSRGG